MKQVIRGMIVGLIISIVFSLLLFGTLDISSPFVSIIILVSTIAGGFYGFFIAKKSKWGIILLTIALIGIIYYLGNIFPGRCKCGPHDEATPRTSIETTQSSAYLFFNDNKTYVGVCNDKQTIALMNAVEAQTKHKPICKSNETQYIIQAYIPEFKKYYCVDSMKYNDWIDEEASGLQCK